MKIECPKCHTGGKLDPARVPDGGANIRCPSCAAVFFVQKPNDATAPPASVQTSAADSAPKTAPGKPQGAAIGGPRTGESFNLTGSLPEVTQDSSPEPPTPASRTASGSSRRAAARSAVTAARTSGAWKVKNSTGMVYNFPDTQSIRAWLEGRTSHSDLLISPDDGTTWLPVAETPDLADVEPRGFRTSSMSLSVGMQQAAAAAGARRAAQADAQADAQVEEYRSEAAKAAAARAVEEAEKAKEAAEAEARSAEEAEAAAEAAKVEKKKKKKKEAPPKSKRMRDHDAAMQRSRRNFRIATGLVFILVVTAGWVVTKQAEVRQTLPDSPVGEQLEWVIDAINGESVEMASAEVEQHFLPSSLQGAGNGDVGRGARLILNELRFWHDTYPFYQFDRLLGRTTETYLEAQLDTSVGEAGVIGLEVEMDPPHRIVSLWIRPLEL